MPPGELLSLVVQLDSSQQRISNLLDSVADDQDWQPAPGEWSLRFIAGHLAIAEKECFLDRIERIASGEEPSFEYYSNDGYDFSGVSLRDALQDWRATRRAIFARLLGMPESAWSLTGTHRSYGRITLMDVLRSMLAHDREHLDGLQSILAKYPNSG
ncbi:MAG: DinB family protein [Anaerolineales bacterium]|jgi:hypothetical protein